MQSSKEENKFTIREMTQEDIDEIIKIEKEIFSNPWSKKMFQNELENPFGGAYVITNNKSILGYITYWEIIDEIYITNIGVKKELQKKGLGGKLINLIFNKAKEGKFSSILLEVRKSNKNAINFYLKHGFKKIGERKYYYDKPKEDAIIMEKIVDAL